MLKKKIGQEREFMIATEVVGIFSFSPLNSSEEMLPPTHAKKELLYCSHNTLPLILLKKKSAFCFQRPKCVNRTAMIHKNYYGKNN